MCATRSSEYDLDHAKYARWYAIDRQPTSRIAGSTSAVWSQVWRSAQTKLARTGSSRAPHAVISAVSSRNPSSTPRIVDAVAAIIEPGKRSYWRTSWLERRPSRSTISTSRTGGVDSPQATSTHTSSTAATAAMRCTRYAQPSPKPAVRRAVVAGRNHAVQKAVAADPDFGVGSCAARASGSVDVGGSVTRLSHSAWPPLFAAPAAPQNRPGSRCWPNSLIRDDSRIVKTRPLTMAGVRLDFGGYASERPAGDGVMRSRYPTSFSSSGDQPVLRHSTSKRIPASPGTGRKFLAGGASSTRTGPPDLP